MTLTFEDVLAAFLGGFALWFFVLLIFNVITDWRNYDEDKEEK